MSAPTPITNRSELAKLFDANIVAGDTSALIRASTFRYFALQVIVRARASADLTSNNTNVADGATVTIGTKVYTFKTTLTPTEGEVLIGADADGSLLNLIRAINHTGTPDTDYKCAEVHPSVFADAAVSVGHAITVRALVGGVAGNSIATAEDSATLTWSGPLTLAGGAETGTSKATVHGTLESENPTHFSPIEEVDGSTNEVHQFSGVWKWLKVVRDAGFDEMTVWLARGEDISS